MIELHNISTPEDPEQAFAAVVALRRLAGRIEAEAVSTALRQGWSWSRIAQPLGANKPHTSAFCMALFVGVAARALRSMGVDLQTLRSAAEAIARESPWLEVMPLVPQ